MTFDFPENDIRMSQYIADKVVEIGRAMGGKTVARGGTRRPYTTTAYQSTHNAGGAVMGDDPKTSVVNRYLQCWDVPNVFSIGGSAIPQNGSYNYTGTIGAPTYDGAGAGRAQRARRASALPRTAISSGLNRRTRHRAV
jgi:gluconate 2-dehydrogenase alpha chain